MGRDIGIYLQFLKYQAVMFSVIFGTSFCVLIPLYWSGNDASSYLKGLVTNSTQASNSSESGSSQSVVYEDNFGLTERDVGYNMLMLTILNIQSDKSKLIISYLSIFAITFIVYIQIFKLWRTTSAWGDMNFDRGQDLYFSEMKNYMCSYLDNINIKLRRTCPRHSQKFESRSSLSRDQKRFARDIRKPPN